MRTRDGIIVILLAFLPLSACESKKDEELSEEKIAALIPSHVSARLLWARDVRAALHAIGKTGNAERVCAVLAVIEQESGYQADPIVPDLPRIVREGLGKKLERLGPLAAPALSTLLDLHPPGSQETFGQRINRLRSEKDLDRLFRDIDAAYRSQMPQVYRVAGVLSFLFGKGSLETFNPVTTAGSMQVKVEFAKSRGSGKTEAEVRDELYTRAGGILYGTARLLDYPANYDDVIYRFADYNAGYYASRNAAIQGMVQDLTGMELSFDGDLLAYNAKGEVLDGESKSLAALRRFANDNGIWDWWLRYDIRMEKSSLFEKSLTWWKLQRAWSKKMGREAPYARLPDVKIVSPKLLRSRSTAWFAKSVKERYQRCRARL